MNIYGRQTVSLPLWMIPVGILAVPLIEFAAFFVVAGRIGLLPAIVVLIGTSFLGVSLLRRVGGSLMARVSAALSRGQAPDGVARDSLRFSLGCFLLIVPGFVTDAIGLFLVLPTLLRTWNAPVPAPAGARGPHSSSRRTDPNGRVIDLDEGEWRRVP